MSTESRANVIVVLHNSLLTLDGLFAGLQGQQRRIARVVLVDNRSTDATVQRARDLARASDLEVVVVEAENTGFAGGYLRGGAELKGTDQPTLCLNPDVELAEGVLARMLDALDQDPRALVVTAPLLLPSGEPDPSSVRRLPQLSGSALYSVLGRLTPQRLRYNAQVPHAESTSSPRYIEATTGALMLVRAAFRRPEDGIFDTDYWMYGEDLQLCADARRAGGEVVMVNAPPSLHVKGTSSGLPRSRRSNVAFHRAMYLYYRKNLDRGPIVRGAVWGAVHLRLALNIALSAAITRKRALQRRPQWA
jgi:N-acetylglucosaminyl-diphospho-decaprenol L-rhamnosyltransferase